MSTHFLNRLEKIALPEEFNIPVGFIKNVLSSDEDLNKNFEIDNYLIGFCRIGDSASMIVTHAGDVDFEYPILVSGF